MKTYGVLLCDADDTIFDFRRAEEVAFQEAMRAFGLPDGPDWLAVYSGINRALWKAFERGEVTQPVLRVQRFERLLARMNVRRDAAAVAARYTQALGCCAATLPGAEEAVRRWSARVPVIVVTNGIGSVQRGRMERSPIRAYIRGLIISEEVGAAKPDPRMIEAALRAVGCTDRSRALMLGDSLSSDIAGAGAAGVDSCWFNPSGAKNESVHRPTYEIRRYEQLDALLD